MLPVNPLALLGIGLIGAYGVKSSQPGRFVDYVATYGVNGLPTIAPRIRVDGMDGFLGWTYTPQGLNYGPSVTTNGGSGGW